MATETVEVLELLLHGTTVGHLAGYQGGRNTLVFDESYQTNDNRPTLTLSGLSEHPASKKLYAKPWSKQQRLHPVLSNLLPEGHLREWMAQELKIHPDIEFPMFSYLADDLPGALIAKPVEPKNIPEGVLDYSYSIEPVPQKRKEGKVHFSLAGVQMKFSMFNADGRFLIKQPNQLGNWIIKTPSSRHKNVPQNEYTVMKLAELAGINVPEIKLVPLDKLDGLPDINLPPEKEAFAIKRFDRAEDNVRIHMEDFAQVLFRYSHEKYGATNFENIGKIIYEYTGHGLANIQEMAKRLLTNILLANGDAHLKNWSLIYKDSITPELSPAYDIVFTKAYIENEKEISLNMAGEKNWYNFSFEHFEAWSEKVGAPWKAVKPHLEDVLEKSRTLWPEYLDKSTMIEKHKGLLKLHWKNLHKDFHIK